MLNAQFTMCFKDVYTEAPNVLDGIVMSTTTRTTQLVDMLKAKYDVYEISGETIPEFQLFLTNTFNQWVSYYEQMLDAYEEEFDWKLGDVETPNITYGNDTTRVVTPRVKTRTTNTEGIVTTTEDYDLPRSTTTENRPSSKTVVTPSAGQNITENESIAGTDTIHDEGERTETGTRARVNLVQQREKFLKTIRNLYAEFADKFKPCFLDMYL